MSVAALLLLAAALPAADYFVHPEGADSNPGTQAQPWKSLERARSQAYQAGDSLSLFAPASHQGYLHLKDLRFTAEAPLRIGSYGKGRAVIEPEADKQAILLKDCAHVEVGGLAMLGKGRDASTVDGMLVQNDGWRQLEGIKVTGVEISGFGVSGLRVHGARRGFTGLRVTHSSFHHNRWRGLAFSGDWLARPRPHRDAYVGHCKAYSNWGHDKEHEPQGGFVLWAVSGAVVERSEAWDNGGDLPYGSGIFGFWCWSADRVVFQFNESHHNRQSGRCDGGGFDLDGASRECIVQYNYSHDNDGAGVLLAQFPGAERSGPLKGNIVRYNVIENDGNRGGYGGITVWGATAQDMAARAEIYHNVVYAGPAKRGGEPSCFYFLGPHFKDIFVFNNIFIAEPGIAFIKHGKRSDNASTHFRGNNYWSAGGGFKLQWDGESYASLAAWAGKGKAGQEMEGERLLGMNQDPMLLEPGRGGYRLKPGSPMLGRGLDLSRFRLAPGPHDFFGNTLPSAAGLDLGVHQASR